MDVRIGKTTAQLLSKMEMLKALFASLFLLVSSVALGQNGITDKCAGDRIAYDFPIVLRGASELYGAKLRGISAFRFLDGKWESVPVQIDEVNSSGDYVLENGLPYTSKTGDNVYNGNDEFSIEGRSLGDEFSLEQVPREFHQNTAAAFLFRKLRFCAGKQYIGTVLLRLGPETAPIVPVQAAVHFQENPAQISSDIYRYEFEKKNPVLLGQVWLRSEKDDTGNISEHQVIEKSSFVMPLRLPWWAPNFTLTDSNFISSIECWRSGPVRSIVAVGVKFRSFLSLFNLHMFSELVFYRNKFQVPTEIQFTFDPSSYLRPGSGLFYSLTFPAGKGWEVETNLEDLPPVSAKEVKDRGRTALSQEVFYARGRRPEGGFVVNVRVDPAARKLVPPPFFVRKEMFLDPVYLKPWPDILGPGGDMGVYLDISGVRTGVYDFGLDLLLSRKADEMLRDYGSVEAQWVLLDIPTGSPAK